MGLAWFFWGLAWSCQLLDLVRFAYSLCLTGVCLFSDSERYFVRSSLSCNLKIRSESSHLHLRVASSCGLSASNSATHGSDSPRLRRLAASLKQRASSRSHKTWFRIRVLLSGPGKGVRIQKSNFRIPYLSRKSSLATPGWRLVNKSG